MMSSVRQFAGWLGRRRVWFGRRGSRGFTLLELLVSALIASLLVAVLLTFLTSILESNRIEEAKAATQDEVQSALRFIADDLQEAVYIYDADAVSRNAANGGILDELRFFDRVNRIPILVFWKRSFLSPTTRVRRIDGTSWLAGCLEYNNQNAGANDSDCRTPDGVPKGRGKFRYSLVSYYLQKDSDNPADFDTPGVWSNAARIIRFELRDGVPWSCFNGSSIDAARSGAAPGCPTPPSAVLPPGSGATLLQNEIFRRSGFIVNSDDGFAPFDLASAGTLKEKFNRWRPSGSYGTGNPAEVLLDFVDDSPYVNGQDTGGATNNAVRVDVGPNTTTGSAPNIITVNQDCSDPNRGVGVEDYNPADPSTHIAQRIPGQFEQNADPRFARVISGGAARGTYTSFYVCIANAGRPNQTSARIWIRANYRVRLQPNINFRQSGQNSAELVTGSTTVLGRGLFNIDS
ncbi:MAG: prepilin-type N-terminal cleavage/methylation domain-containing protein [Oscillatoriales cyanobacterium SM2_2_1]|nr:prepilin-type N-terminal cleavage/methylation domain-containing protein [Oscillatoriales cyanobacterium SM2_2_1]